jgi:ABC-type nitrate/sulfonate/bicarbonate transport system permease component
MYTEVLLPRALPFVLAGMRIGIATGTFALAAAEMAGAFEGLVFRVLYSYQMFQTEKMMAGIVVVGCLSFAMDRCFYWGVRAAMPWWEEPDEV